MKKLLLALLVCLPLLTGWSSTPSWNDTIWEGTTDADMLKQVRSDLAIAKAASRNLRVQLLSPGGSVVFCLEMARLIRNASDDGMIVEIHGSGIVASCGTFVLAAGTPGHRYISFSTLFLVHAPKRGGYAAGCVEWKDNPKDEDDKVGNEFLLLMAQSYTRYTGRLDTLAWLKCDASAVGVTVALERGLADKVER